MIEEEHEADNIEVQTRLQFIPGLKELGSPLNHNAPVFMPSSGKGSSLSEVCQKERCATRYEF